jgi:methylthioribulose-1-phosphate dehydratase
MDPRIAALIEAGRVMESRGWVPATSGNLSVRLGETPFVYAMSASGGAKGRLTGEDFIEFAPGMRRIDGASAPRSSAETEVHDLLYASLSPGCVLHGHPFHATLVSRRRLEAGFVRFEGWELIKALGFWGERDVVSVPVVANHAAIPALARAVAEAATAQVPAVMVAGHGVYAWGASVPDALRHLEAIEVLSALVWEEFRVTGQWP